MHSTEQLVLVRHGHILQHWQILRNHPFVDLHIDLEIELVVHRIHLADQETGLEIAG